MKTEEIKKNIRSKILKYAILSRVLLIFFQYIGNLVITDHDAKVFVSPVQGNFNGLDNFVQHLFGGFVRWDAQYFLHIANYGYTYENTLAFFPLYPLILRFISMVLLYFYSFMNFSTMLLLISVIFNSFLFVKTALLLYEITAFVENPKIVYMAVMVFCFNPASVFFSAPYSECLFAYLTFKAILCCIKYIRTYSRLDFTYVNSACIKCVFYISLSTCTRSNGILNMGFFIYAYLFLVVQTFYKLNKSNFAKYVFLMISLMFLVFYISAMLLPFTLVQVYDYINYCKNFETNVPEFLKDLANENNYILPGTFSEHKQSWCYDNIPLAYAYIQKHYWDVGFLKYFQFKQVPNFLLATPVLYITITNSYKFLKQHGDYCFHLGIFRRFFKMTDIDLKVSVKFACVIHIVMLAVFCFFFIHVQVTTRMIFSATPCIYWFCASHHDHIRTKNLIFLYCMSYFIVGTVMFCNFLPWT